MPDKKRVLLIFGTRPEAIKLVPLINALRSSQSIDLKICISAQHREILDSVLNEYGISADFDLDLMKDAQTLDYITTQIIIKLGNILDLLSPDLVLVHGDTTTAFAGALSAFYRNIPIGHIEAGLRSNNILSPFPEEFNRRSISMIAKYHFCPTPSASANLLREGVSKESIFTVGNTAIDTLKVNLDDTEQPVTEQFSKFLGKSRYLLITVHRREHSDNELEGIFDAIRTICLRHSDIRVIYPLHKSPKLRKKAINALSEINNLLLSEPINTKEFHSLLSGAYILLTDSGGIQEEASFLGKPTLVLRDTTERPEGIEAGVLKLVGSSCKSIVDTTEKLLMQESEYSRMAHSSNVYGDGCAAQRIADIIEKLK